MVNSDPFIGERHPNMKATKSSQTLKTQTAMERSEVSRLRDVLLETNRFR